MASYSQPSQEWTFYEINPDVIDLACNSQYSTYLQNCGGGSLNVIEGDARLNLQNADAGHYGVIVLDAFSSDAIPVHLVTEQALDLYLSKNQQPLYQLAMAAAQRQKRRASLERRLLQYFSGNQVAVIAPLTIGAGQRTRCNRQRPRARSRAGRRAYPGAALKTERHATRIH